VTKNKSLSWHKQHSRIVVSCKYWHRYRQGYLTKITNNITERNSDFCAVIRRRKDENRMEDRPKPVVSPDVHMKDTYAQLAADVIDRAGSSSGTRQYLVGISGPPGGGKSTTALALHAMIPNSVVVPMDGYHYTKERLATFADPVEATARRGAHWTFDGDRFVSDLRALKENGHGVFPAFAHAVGDPEEGAIRVLGPDQHKVVIVEGNYLTLEAEPWNDLVSILDRIYFLDCPLEVVEQRVAHRHMRVNGNTAERAWERVRYNDSPNAQLILASKHRAHVIVQSL
jgi:pantothenate kinase